MNSNTEASFKQQDLASVLALFRLEVFLDDLLLRSTLSSTGLGRHPVTGACKHTIKTRKCKFLFPAKIEVPAVIAHASFHIAATFGGRSPLSSGIIEGFQGNMSRYGIQKGTLTKQV